MEQTIAPEMYKACPYRNVDAAFARFYEAPDARFGVATASGRLRLRLCDVGDSLHRLILRRRAAQLDPMARTGTTSASAALAGWLKRKSATISSTSATAAAM